MREEMVREVEDRVEESFLKQSNMVGDECLREFAEVAGKIFGREKNVELVREERDKVV